MVGEGGEKDIYTVWPVNTHARDKKNLSNITDEKKGDLTYHIKLDIYCVCVCVHEKAYTDISKSVTYAP